MTDFFRGGGGNGGFHSRSNRESKIGSDICPERVSFFSLYVFTLLVFLWNFSNVIKRSHLSKISQNGNASD